MGGEWRRKTEWGNRGREGERGGGTGVGKKYRESKNENEWLRERELQTNGEENGRLRRLRINIHKKVKLKRGK